MSVKDIISWHWTPLLDGALTRAYFNRRGRADKQFLEDITAAIAPRLRQVPYDKKPVTLLTTIKKSVKLTLNAAQRYGIGLPNSSIKKSKIPDDSSLLTFWNTTLLSEHRRVWPELVDESFVRELVRAKPTSELLWNLATVELTAQAFSNKPAIATTVGQQVNN